MRPEKANALINKAIQDALSGNVESLYKSEFLSACYKLLLKLKIELPEECWKEYSEHKTSVKDYDGVRLQLFYISDRFNAPNRLKWLIFGVNNRLFNKENITDKQK